MKIAVFGAGGVGGYFGARLASGGADVHLLARGRHLEALREEGLQVRSERGDLHLKLPSTDSPAEVGPSDVVLFCVKSTDTRKAADSLGPLLREKTAVITLQNGVDNEEALASVIGAEHVVGGVAYIFATISAPAVIEHKGALARIVFGELDGRRSDRLASFLEVCRSASVDAELTETIRVELWRKFALICATAGMTAAVRLPLGAIRESAPAFEMYRRIVAEVSAVARAEGVALPEDTVERIVDSVAKLPGHWYSSLHYDLTHGKPMELEALHGEAVRLARRHGVDVPMCEAVRGVLDPWAIRNRDEEKSAAAD
jgi:2-dehydropantoate 2-reductase